MIPGGGGQGDHGPPTFQGRAKNIFVINYKYKGNELVAPPTLKHLLTPMHCSNIFCHDRSWK